LKKDFKVIIFSNGNKKRLKPFKDALNVDVSYLSMKPLPYKFLRIIKLYKYNLDEVAIVGDQIYTDIIGGNKVGITTILVNPISVKDGLLTKINRLREKYLFKKLLKRDLFRRGKYYE
jgi:hypothetical protein